MQVILYYLKCTRIAEIFASKEIGIEEHDGQSDFRPEVEI